MLSVTKLRVDSKNYIQNILSEFKDVQIKTARGQFYSNRYRYCLEQNR